MSKYRYKAVYTIEPFKPGMEDRIENGEFVFNGSFMDMVAVPGDYIKKDENGFCEVLSEEDFKEWFEPVEQEQASHE